MSGKIQPIVDDVKSGKKTAREYIEAALKRAEEAQEYNALLSLTRERAISRADEIDASIENGEEVGRLAGVPFVVKDNFLAFGAPTTAASKILENFVAPLQATAVEKLEEAGAICIGKANLDAFAHGGSTENSAFGVTKNAVDQSKVAGGSSGGSAVVTALDIVPFALGTDTGGSVRQPASFNGVYGMKPTYGMISRFGVVAMASSTDVIGTLATSAEDTTLVLDVMAGRDERDHTTLPNYFAAVDTPPDKLKVGVIKEMMTDDVEPDVLGRVNEYLEGLRSFGHTVETVSLPIVEHTLAMYYIIVPAEVSSNLARYDGIRYGRRADGVQSLAELYGRSRNEGFVTENKRRIMIGSFVLSSGFFEAYYQQAQKARTLLIRDFNTLFESHDVLICPTSPTTAFAIGANTADPIKMYLADVMTVPASLAGLPALSMPFGVDTNNLPVGVQLIGPQRSDAQLLSIAKQMEDDRG